MKQLSIILLVLSCAFNCYSQNTGGGLLPASKHQAVNKSILTNGTRSVDAKYKYYDTINFKERAFMSVAEANSYNPLNQRPIGLTVLINSGGSLSAGVITGGTNSEYQYINGTANGNLVPKTATVTFAVDTTTARGATTIVMWGNSLTRGTGSVPTTVWPGGYPSSEMLEGLTGYEVINQGNPGETSIQILARFLAHPEWWYYGQIFELGTNNSSDTAQVLNDFRRIKFILDSIGNPRYLFTNIPGFSNSTGWSGTPQYIQLQAMNAKIATIGGINHYADVRAALVAAYNPGNAQDIIDHGHDIQPTSLMYPGDPIHYNYDGYVVWAQTYANMISIMKPAVGVSTIATSALKGIFSNAPPITSPLLAASQAVINYTRPTTTFFTDANGNANLNVLEINGGVSIRSNTATGGQIAGIDIRNHLNNLGGKAALSIMGSSSAWTSTYQGIIPRNDFRRFDVGSDVQITGVLSNIGDVNVTGGVSISGILNASSYTNVPFSTPARVIDVNASNGGIRIPRLDQTAADVVGGGSPYGGGQPLFGEIMFNTTKGRFEGGHIKNSPYAGWSTIPFLQDIDGTQTKIIPGPGIGVSGTGSILDPYNVSNLSFPPASLITGTAYGTIPDLGSPTNTFDKAFDSLSGTRNIATEWRGASSNSENYIGIDLGSNASVLTKVTFYPGQGLTASWVGAIVQGSNTSATTGFTNMYTFASAPTDFAYSTVTISSSTAYRWIRIYKSGTRLDAADVQFYGYVPTPLFTLTTTGTGVPTFVTNTLNIPQNSIAKQTHTSGATVTVTSGTTGTIWLVVNPASTLAALTVTMPATPVDGQQVEISFGGTITSGSVVTSTTTAPNSGQSMLVPVTAAAKIAGSTIKYRYNLTNTTWYPN